METPVNANPRSLVQRFPLAVDPLFTANLRVAVLLLLCSLVLPSATSIAAQQPLSLADAGLRAQTIFQQSASTGMVLVVVRNREVMIKSYGGTSPASGHSPKDNSLIRLCSVSKVFTVDLLLKRVAQLTPKAWAAKTQS